MTAPAACTALRALALGALLAILPAMLPLRAAEPAPGHAPLTPHRRGEQTLLVDCLRFSVLDFTDRNGPLDGADWVTVRVENACREPMRHLLVDLLLVDPAGEVYGGSVWVLTRGEILYPGADKTARYALPDPANRSPRLWAVRLRRLETPTKQYVDDQVRPRRARTAAR